MKKVNLRFFYIIPLLFLSACQPTSKSSESLTINSQQKYTLHFGKQGTQDFLKYSKEETDHQPAGASFNSLDFSPPSLGKLKIEHGVNSLVIDNVFSVLGTQFLRPHLDGIQILDIDSGLTKEEFADPEKAYWAYVELMKRINQAGWKNYFFSDAPRISKEDNIKYLSKSRDIIDPSYIFAFDEWKKIISNIPTKSLGYRLYANGIVLDISLKQTAKNDRNEEQYMLRLSFQTARYIERNLISNSDEMTPNELENAFQKRLVNNKKHREIEERKAIAEGYHIDKEYVDPDVWPYVK